MTAKCSCSCTFWQSVLNASTGFMICVYLFFQTTSARTKKLSIKIVIFKMELQYISEPCFHYQQKRQTLSAINNLQDDETSRLTSMPAAAEMSMWLAINQEIRNSPWTADLAPLIACHDHHTNSVTVSRLFLANQTIVIYLYLSKSCRSVLVKSPALAVKRISS